MGEINKNLDTLTLCKHKWSAVDELLPKSEEAYSYIILYLFVFFFLSAQYLSGVFVSILVC